MKMRFCNILLPLLVFAAEVYTDPVQVATFKMLPFDRFGNAVTVDPATFYFLENRSGDDIAYPYLIREAEKYGVYDYVTQRVMWINGEFAISQTLPYEVEGVQQGDGIHVRYYDDGLVFLYTNSRTSYKEIRIELPGQQRPLAGGVWYQSGILFFYDEKGDLHVIENPGVDQDNNLPKVEDRIAAMKLIRSLGSSRLAGLGWSDSYGVTNDGYPLARVFNKDWIEFFLTKRMESKLQVDEKRQIPPASWQNSVRLLGVADDGTSYWGSGSASIVDSNGFLIGRESWQPPIGSPLVLPNGDILLRSVSPSKQTLKLFQIRRTW